MTGLVRRHRRCIIPGAYCILKKPRVVNASPLSMPYTDLMPKSRLSPVILYMPRHKYPCGHEHNENFKRIKGCADAFPLYALLSVPSLSN